MDWGALAAAVVALAVGIASITISSRTEAKRREAERELVALQNDFSTRERAESRRVDLEARLSAQREPLIEAARDLEQRLGNIRDGAFLDFYVHGSTRRRADLAVLSTLYRLSRYFAAVERMRSGVDAWTLETDPRTAGVEAALRTVAKTLATDSWGDLMLWREEQRAIGELMLVSDGRQPIGFAEFSERYTSDFLPWLADFREELSRPEASSSPRLEALQVDLSNLREQLESGRRSTPLL